MSSLPPSVEESNEEDPLLGRRIGGRLRLIECIGRGSMGRVYRAHHETLDKNVAIKVLSDLLDLDDIRARRFVREARTASRLDHPHTVQILDFGRDGEDGLLYLAMEYLEGEDLCALLARERRLDPDRIIEIMVQTLAAIAAAHDHGIIHRDIKPSNIFLTRRRDDEGRLVDFVKVCDFGIAKFLASARDSLAGTSPGRTEVVGTPLYMSPEQAVGDTLDPRTDVYSAGVVLYEMLTGQTPFVGETPMGVMLKHVSEPPAAPSTLLPSIDPDLESVLGWTLVKDREQRCPSAREFRSALRDVRGRTGTTGPLDSQDVASPIDGQLRAYLDAMSKPNPAEGADAEAPAGHVEDSDTYDALVAQAVDEVREETVTPRPRGDESMPGLDPRRAGEAISDRATYLWNHYGVVLDSFRGEDPFYVRDHTGEVMGPCTYRDATRVIQVESARGHAAKVAVAGKQKQWISAGTFARLTGQEAILEPKPGEHESLTGPFSGSLATTSLAALFARVTRERPTGRLVFHLAQNVEETRVEVHLVSGQPTFVYSSEPGLQIPALLVRRDLLEEKLIPRFLQMAIEEERPLEQIVGREANIDMTQYRAIFMRERLAYLFRWQRGRFGLDTESLPSRMSPFDHSLMAVLPDVVYRAMSRDALRAAVQRYLDIPIERSQRFKHGIAAMQLSSAQKGIVRRFLGSRTLGEAVPSEPKLEKLYYAMAYILLETELFLKPIGPR